MRKNIYIFQKEKGAFNMEYKERISPQGNRIQFVVFNGAEYSRKPDTKSKTRSKYYSLSEKSKRGIFPSELHRAVWEFYNGKIPKGYVVHHKDLNKDNNEIENLECISMADHNRLHHSLGDLEEQRKTMDHARQFAPAWHGTPEGIEWHKKHGQETWVGKEKRFTHTCIQCGVVYKSFYDVRRGKTFCSRHCNSSYNAKINRYKEQSSEIRICTQCGKEFKTIKYGKAQSCSDLCAASLRRQRRNAAKDIKNASGVENN